MGTSTETKYLDLDNRLHDDFVKLDQEADPYDQALNLDDKMKNLDIALLQETNQDGLIVGHMAF